MILAPRDHGGNLEQARATYGGDDWIDLSTGINRVPYPMPAISPAAFATLPTQAAMAALLKAAAVAYGTSAPIVALSGAQAAIQLVPHLRPTGLARVVGPTYNEHAATLRACGWQVEEVRDLHDLIGADIAVVVNPNNPDGRHWTRKALLDLVGDVGLLVVDESFADPMPVQSLVADAGQSTSFQAATGRMRVRPYVDATNGAIIDVTNTAESAYLPLTLTGSTLRLFGGGGTGAVVRGASRLRISRAQLPLRRSRVAIRARCQRAPLPSDRGTHRRDSDHSEWMVPIRPLPRCARCRDLSSSEAAAPLASVVVNYNRGD